MRNRERGAAKRTRPAWLMIASLMAATGSQAQVTAPLPTITSVHPLGAQAGTTVEVTMKGSDLDGGKGLLFTPSPLPGFQVETKRDASGLPLPGQFRVTLPKDAVPGRYDVRFVGTFGVSNVRRFEVGVLPEIAISAEAFKAETPLKVEPNTTVNGMATTNAPVHLEVMAKKGQRLLVICRGESLDTVWRSDGRVLDPAGREIARMKNQLIDFTPSRNGPHRIELHDLMYRTGDTTGFRATITDGPLVRFAMRTNAAGKSVLYGLNLPGGSRMASLGLERLEVDREKLDQRLRENVLDVTVLEREDEAANAAPKSTSVKASQTYGGWFAPYGQPRTFDLPVTKGERYVIEVVSSELGLPTDPTLFIETVKVDDKGAKTVATQAEVFDLGTPSPFPMLRRTVRDPVYVYTAPADGKLRLHVTDSANSVGRQRFPFELRIREAGGPDLITTAATVIRPKNDRTGVWASSNVWRGGITAVEVQAPHRSAVADAIGLYVKGCPPGVTCLGGFMGPKQGIGYLAFQAEHDAPGGAVSLPDWSGSGMEILGKVRDFNREPLRIRKTAGLALGVAESMAPARIEIEGKQPFQAAAGSKLEIPLKALRQNDFADALKLKVLGLIDSDKAPSADIAAKSDTGTLTLDLKALKLSPGDYGCILQGTAKMKVSRGTDELALAEKNAQKAAAKLDAAKRETANVDVLKKAEAAKVAADKLVADRKAKGQPKDAVFLVYSQPIRLRVTEAAKP